MGVGNDDKFPNLKFGSWLSARENLEPDKLVDSTFVRAIEALTKLALLRLSHVRQEFWTTRRNSHSTGIAWTDVSEGVSCTTKLRSDLASSVVASSVGVASGVGEVR